MNCDWNEVTTAIPSLPAHQRVGSGCHTVIEHNQTSKNLMGNQSNQRLSAVASKNSFPSGGCVPFCPHQELSAATNAAAFPFLNFFFFYFFLFLFLSFSLSLPVTLFWYMYRWLKTRHFWTCPTRWIELQLSNSLKCSNLIKLEARTLTTKLVWILIEELNVW